MWFWQKSFVSESLAKNQATSCSLQQRNFRFSSKNRFEYDEIIMFGPVCGLFCSSLNSKNAPTNLCISLLLENQFIVFIWLRRCLEVPLELFGFIDECIKWIKMTDLYSLCHFLLVTVLRVNFSQSCHTLIISDHSSSFSFWEKGEKFLVFCGPLERVELFRVNFHRDIELARA